VVVERDFRFSPRDEDRAAELTGELQRARAAARPGRRVIARGGCARA